MNQPMHMMPNKRESQGAKSMTNPSNCGVSGLGPRPMLPCGPGCCSHVPGGSHPPPPGSCQPPPGSQMMGPVPPDGNQMVYPGTLCSWILYFLF